MEFADNFKRFIEYMNIEVVNIDSNIAEQGAKIRGKYKHFKAMDALQIATAIISGCDIFPSPAFLDGIRHKSGFQF